MPRVALTHLSERLERLALVVRALDLDAERRGDMSYEQDLRDQAVDAQKELRRVAIDNHGVDVLVTVDDDRFVPPLRLAKQWIATELALLMEESVRLHVAAAQRRAAEAEENADEWADGRRYAAVLRAEANRAARSLRKRPPAGAASTCRSRRESRARRRRLAGARRSRARAPDEPEPPLVDLAEPRA